MKNLKLVVLILFVAALFSNPANSSMMVRGPLKQILLQGQLDSPKARSLFPPVEVFQYEYHLQVKFLSSLGALNIVVVDDLGLTAFQTSVNATAGSSLTIDTDEWEGGNYSIKICNGSNQCVEGSFIIVGDDE